MPPDPRSLALRLPRGAARRIPAWIGAGAWEAMAGHLAAGPPVALAVVVSDDTVARLHGERLLQILRERTRAELLTFPAGEASKTRDTKARLEDALEALGAGRDTAIVALGGGVTGDLAGFLAATWTRGVPVHQVPTSLLAMVDASVGGKTAVDLPGGKNLVGAFHQPASLAIDPGVLATLPEEELRHGLAEAVKLAAVADAGLFATLERDAERILARDPGRLEGMIARCVLLKHRIVVRDEREAGPRAALNFGHTVGHAMESLSGYAIPHGRAVAAGCAIEAAIAAAATAFPPRHRARLEGLLARFGLPVRWPAGLPWEGALPAMQADKKVRRGRVRYALPARLGKMPAGVVTEVDPSVVRRVLADAAAGG